MLYQGPEIEDLSPPKEEEVKKPAAAKGGKAVAVVVEEPLIRMIKPEPVLMKAETGRTF